MQTRYLTCAMYCVLHCRAWLSLNRMPLKWYWRDENLVCNHRVLSQGSIDNTREWNKRWLVTNIFQCSGWGICVPHCVFFYLICLYVSVISFVFTWFLPIVNSPNLLFVYQLFHLFKKRKEKRRKGRNRSS